jgi:hypothetical protein
MIGSQSGSTDRTPADQDFRAAFQLIAFDDATGARLHGFGACLDDVKLAVFTILGPFDIHWTAIVFLDSDGHFRQRGNVVVVD